MTAAMKKPGLGEGRAFRNARCLVKDNTQQARVLELLRQRPMSAAELQWELRIAHAPAAVRDLIAKGYCIKVELHPRAEGRPIHRYHLIETD